ncbi:MAG: hypothetical protein AVDCRST_MAG19-1748, partial [uncultured Thermomicrobiales bacterium]
DRRRPPARPRRRPRAALGDAGRRGEAGDLQRGGPRRRAGGAGRRDRGLDAGSAAAPPPDLPAGALHAGRRGGNRADRLLAEPDPADVGVRRGRVRGRPDRTGRHRPRFSAAGAGPAADGGRAPLERGARGLAAGHHRHPLVLPPVRLRDGAGAGRSPPRRRRGRAGPRRGPRRAVRAAAGDRGGRAVHGRRGRARPGALPRLLRPRRTALALRARRQERRERGPPRPRRDRRQRGWRRAGAPRRLRRPRAGALPGGAPGVGLRSGPGCLVAGDRAGAAPGAAGAGGGLRRGGRRRRRRVPVRADRARPRKRPPALPRPARSGARGEPALRLVRPGAGPAGVSPPRHADLGGAPGGLPGGGAHRRAEAQLLPGRRRPLLRRRPADRRRRLAGAGAGGGGGLVSAADLPPPAARPPLAGRAGARLRRLPRPGRGGAGAAGRALPKTAVLRLAGVV